MKWNEISNDHVTEIEDINARLETHISKMALDLSDVKPEWNDPNNQGLNMRVGQSSDQSYYQLYLDNELVALVITEPRHGIHQIKTTAVAPKHRQRGYIRMLFTWIRNHVGPLCSDDGQTRDAVEMWKALIGKPGNLKIYVWNVETDDKKPAKGVPDQDIWNDDPDTLLLIEEIDWRWRKNLLEEVDPYPHHYLWGPDLRFDECF